MTFADALRAAQGRIRMVREDARQSRIAKLGLCSEPSVVIRTSPAPGGR